MNDKIFQNNAFHHFAVSDPGANCCHFPGNKYITLKADSGYIASSVTETTGCGNEDCPWLLSAAKGQQLNITLYDFAVLSTGVSINAYT